MASLRRFVKMMPQHLRLPDDEDTSAPFTLRHVIGSGAGGTAISATLTADERERRCIKLMEISTAEPRYMEVLERCRLEALSLSKCNSVFIVKFFDVFEVADPSRNAVYFALVCEECAAGDLRNQVKLRMSGRHGVGIFSEMEALLLFVQVLMALNHIHELKMMHRDIKTSNTFMTQIGAVKLGDFGFAKSFQNSLSMSDTPCGTPDMMAPELWRRNRYTKKVDMYALGVVFYELLTGRRPFDLSLKGARSMETIAQASLDQDPDPLPDTLSESTKAIVMSLLRKDPTQRPTCRDLMQTTHVIAGINRLEAVLPQSPEYAALRAAIIDEIHANRRFMNPDDADEANVSGARALERKVTRMLNDRSMHEPSVSWATSAGNPDSVMSALWIGSPIKKLSSDHKWKSRYIRVASLDGSQFDLAIVVTLDSTPLNLIAQNQKQVIRLKFVDDVHLMTPDHAEGMENVMLVVNCRSPNFCVQFPDAESCHVWVMLLKELIAEQVYVNSASSEDGGAANASAAARSATAPAANTNTSSSSAGNAVPS